MYMYIVYNMHILYNRLCAVKTFNVVVYIICRLWSPRRVVNGWTSLRRRRSFDRQLTVDSGTVWSESGRSLPSELLYCIQLHA